MEKLKRNMGLSLAMALVLCSCESTISTIKDVDVIQPNSAFNVTKIIYSPDTTYVTFRAVCHSDSNIVIDNDMAIIDDNGVEHHSIGVQGIVFGQSCATNEDFTVGFTPVNAKNKAIDVKMNNRYMILGLHDASHSLELPAMQNSGYPTQSLEPKQVNIKIVLHGYSGNSEDIYMAVQYHAPFKKGNQHHAVMTSNGIFCTNFEMYSPKMLLVYAYGAIKWSTKIFVCPGDNICIDVYENGKMEYTRLTQGSDIKPLDKDMPPAVDGLSRIYEKNLYNGRVIDSETGVSTDYTSFSIISYEEQRNKLMIEYKDALKRAEYIVWHYNLSPLEAAMYTAHIHDIFCSLLLSTEIRAGYMYEEALNDDVKKQYAFATTNDAYNFLKLVPQNETAFALVDMDIPEMISSLKPMRDCYNIVPKDDPNWCTKVIMLQLDLLYKIAEWENQSYMTQITMIALAKHLSIFFEDQFEISGNDMCRWLQEQLLDPYCRSLLVALIHNSSD